MTKPKYFKIQTFLKEQIQQGKYKVGDYLPSENELCTRFSITRTTARKALDELLREGFIEKLRGKGSRVKERRKSLGLLAVKGFSEAVGENVKARFLQKPVFAEWGSEINIKVSEQELEEKCIYFERLRYVGDTPVLHECNWFSSKVLEGFHENDFVEGSFFKTLSKKYLIEVVGSTSELRAESAGKKISGLLQIEPGTPVLHISLLFKTSNPELNIYAELLCNTNKYPVGNTYFI